jgi:colicin import membrane protein
MTGGEQVRHSIAIAAIFAVLAGAVLILMNATYERRVVELRSQLEQAKTREVEAAAAAKAASTRAFESALAEAKAMAEKAGAERAAAEKAAAQARASARWLAAERAAAERAAAERVSKLVAERAALERAAAEARTRADEARVRADEARRNAEAAAARAKAVAERAKLASTPTPSAESLYAEASALERDDRGAEAVRIYVQAARAGSGKAAKRLGEIYDRGISGVERNYAESLKWYNAARVLGEDVPMMRR